MFRLTRDMWLGVCVIAFGAFLLLVLVPYGVTSPANVRIAVLSPTIWPNIIAVSLMIIGAILVVRGFVGASEKLDDVGSEDGWHPAMRVVATAILMAALFFSMPVLGMPIASCLTLLVYAFMVQARRPVATILTAILLPLMIYGFFSKVAGVPIPQGQLVRLP